MEKILNRIKFGAFSVFDMKNHLWVFFRVTAKDIISRKNNY